MLLPPGPIEITYFLTLAESAQVETIVEKEDYDESPIIISIIGAIVAVIAAVVFKFRKKSDKNTPKSSQDDKESEKQLELESTLSDEDVREDDKEIIKFIHENGGEVLESELRKKFLQPRTTMWRAVKRLERHGKITIIKKDQQNLVKLKTQEIEDE